MRHIKRSDLLPFAVDLPSLREQRRIAAILDEFDEGIRRTEQIVAKLKQIKQGLLRDLLTRGIDENGELRDPKRHPEQFKDSQLGLIPKIWTVGKLSALSSRIVDGVHHTPTYVSRGVPFLTVENLSRGPGISLTPCRYVSERDNVFYRRRADPKPGDVLVSKDGTLGIARTIPDGFPEVSIFVSVALLRPRTDRVLAEFVREFFESAWFTQQLGRQSAGTGLRHIHLEHFREFLLAVPPLEEQQRLLSVLDRFSARLDREFQELSKLRLLKRGLMEDLLTGRVRVSDLEAAA
jgi:type I restriction enzyme S subunit